MEIEIKASLNFYLNLMDLLGAIYIDVNWMEFDNLRIYRYIVRFDFKCLNVFYFGINCYVRKLMLLACGKVHNALALRRNISNSRETAYGSGIFLVFRNKQFLPSNDILKKHYKYFYR